MTTADQSVGQKRKGLSGKTIRIVYIIEALVEYLICIPIEGSFVTTVASYVGMSETSTGILNGLMCLGSVSMLVGIIVFHGKFSKKIVVGFTIANQLLYVSLYLIPNMGLEKNATMTALFAVALASKLVFYMVHSMKTVWLMSFVPDSTRGKFTAIKEMISLAVGMIYTVLMSSMVDRFKEQGDLKTAFYLCAAIISGLSLIHIGLFLMTPSVNSPKTSHQKMTLKSLREIFGNDKVIKITIVFAFFRVAANVSVPYFYIYALNNLQYTLTQISLINILHCVSRMALSLVFGAYADKKSFARMLRICFAVVGAGMLINSFSAPGITRYMYVVFYVMYGIGLAGVNSSFLNLVYDYVPEEQHQNAFAITQSISFTLGFVANVAVSPIVTAMINNEIILFGQRIYPQQVLSLIACALLFSGVVFLSKNFIKK